jgi:hypothetical protein
MRLEDAKKHQDLRTHNKNNNDPRYAKMPFGKYKGWFMKDIPTQYLEWITKNFTDKAQLEWFNRELGKRD